MCKHQLSRAYAEMIYNKLKVGAIIQLMQEKESYFLLLYRVNWTKSLYILTYLDNHPVFHCTLYINPMKWILLMKRYCKIKQRRTGLFNQHRWSQFRPGKRTLEICQFTFIHFMEMSNEILYFPTCVFYMATGISFICLHSSNPEAFSSSCIWTRSIRPIDPIGTGTMVVSLAFYFCEADSQIRKSN